VLDAGLGEVELEPLRMELAGEIAYEAGRCKMLVPHLGKRREERGKYLVTLARQAGEWKIIADCWSSDLSLAAGPESAAKPEAIAGAPRLPRKS
jgi:ketosteroid isomerase-like protein